MNKSERTAAIMFGANLGDPKQMFEQAVTLLEQSAVKIIARSSFYKTQPWGSTDQPTYLNQALLIETRMNPEDFHMLTMETETKLGRTRTLVPNSARTIDIDILLFEDVVINTGQLVIPHPRMHIRRFNLVPMAEIAPHMMHPLKRMTITQLLEACEDPLQVIMVQ